MNTLSHLVLIAATLGAAQPALAGPDWQAIELARKHKQAQVAQADKAAAADPCAGKRLVLPVDHGPRAQTTPYLNEKRRARFEAEMKACREAADSGTRR